MHFYLLFLDAIIAMRQDGIKVRFFGETDGTDLKNDRRKMVMLVRDG
jgi:hypothetical protein